MAVGIPTAVRKILINIPKDGVISIELTMQDVNGDLEEHVYHTRDFYDGEEEYK